uniref:Cyp5139R1 n=1 Tax=Phaffia rhodozyma TaxID=264483 RepID=A0A221SAG5_PHARH|nr:Cyp5139R1 [Phaffia rhodozyma]
MPSLLASLIPSWVSILISIPVLFVSLFIFQFYIRPSLTSYSNLPGPKIESYIWGNMKGLMSNEPGVGHEALVLKYGKTLRYNGFMGMQRFYTADPRAVSYVLNNGYDYPKPARVRVLLEEILGTGLLSAEGGVHQRQRKIVVTSFSRNYIRDMTPVFIEHAYELKDKFLSMIEDDKPTRIDVLEWIGRATLDIIGRAGFDYHFNALKTEYNELADAFQKMFVHGSDVTLLLVLQNFFPFLKFIPTAQSRSAGIALATMERIGGDLVAKKKEAVLESLRTEQAAGDENEKIEVQPGKKDFSGKDILSSLIRSNMARDLPPSQRLHDKEVIGQISTFSLAWCLYAMCENTEIQDKLRAELVQVENDEPSMDELNALPYLDAVCRETLRLYAPIPSTLRVASKDDVLPLSEPIKNTRNGKMMTEVPIAKGTSIFIPILNLNTLDDIWGGDGQIFRPERWMGENFSDAAKEVPGVWTHMSTFISGPRSCVGYRFALVEIKAVLFVLLRSFVFAHCDPRPNFIKKLSFLIVRPRIKGEESFGAQLPMMVTPYRP